MKIRVKKSFLLMILAFVAVGSGSKALLAQTAEDLKQKLEKLDAYPDMVVTSGRIVTMDPNRSRFEAMAIRDGRILALGSDEEMVFLAGPETRILDVQGRMVLPGLIDSHTHPNAWAVKHWLSNGYAEKHDPQLKISYVSGRTSLELVQGVEETIRRRAAELGPGKWIWISLWSGDSLPEARAVTGRVITQKLITPEFLDSIAPDNPVMVWVAGLGPNVNNSMARQIQEQTMGQELHGLRAIYTMPYDIILQGRTTAVADILKKELETCLLPYGITTVVGHIESPATVNALNYLDRRGEMPVRWGWVHRIGYSHASDPAEFYRLLGDQRGQGSHWFWNIGAGEESWEDRSSYTCTEADPLDPEQENFSYAPCPENKSSLDYEASKGYRGVKATVESGLRPTFLHAYLDGSFDAMFRLLEQAIAEGKITLEEIRDARIGLEHNQIIRPDQLEKLAKYGFYLSFQGYQLASSRKGLVFLEEYGERYMKWMMPVKDVVEAGIPIVINTDFHLNQEVPEARELESVWDDSIWKYYEFFLTRQIGPRTFEAEQAIDRMTVLEAATIRGAEYALREDELGSLEPGKLADFVVIDKDYFTIPVEEVGSIQNLLTVVGGEIAYQAEDF